MRKRWRSAASGCGTVANLIATRRASTWSSARYTCPVLPLPSGCRRRESSNSVGGCQCESMSPFHPQIGPKGATMSPVYSRSDLDDGGALLEPGRYDCSLSVLPPGRARKLGRGEGHCAFDRRIAGLVLPDRLVAVLGSVLRFPLQHFEAVTPRAFVFEERHGSPWVRRQR